MDLKEKLTGYLKARFEPTAELLEMKPLGKGVHGNAYQIRFKTDHADRRMILKTLFPSGFGHDHYADRAQVLLLAGANYNELPKHIKALDVVGESPDRLVSVGNLNEFYIFMEEAEGYSYFQDLDAVLKRGTLTRSDRDKARMLALFLADIHEVKYTKPDAAILYRRRIRDLIGHGECIMGIIDAFDPGKFTSESELVDYASKSLPWWGRLRNLHDRLCRVHGDYHPGNIRLKNSDFTLLDRSRGTWGEPADDVSCLAMNYIYYAVKDQGTFKGPFKTLFQIFLESYLEKTADLKFFEVTQPFFAFRALVIANPRFYKEDSIDTKRKLLNFGRSLLESDLFQTDYISNYLEGI